MFNVFIATLVVLVSILFIINVRMAKRCFMHKNATTEDKVWDVILVVIQTALMGFVFWNIAVWFGYV